MRIVTVVGNPRPRSRTCSAAEALAAQLQAELSGPGGDDQNTIDLADAVGELFDPTSATVASYVERVRAADVVVVASPTYKATFTALLKGFLERFQQGELAGTIAVPMMMGGSAHHYLAVEVHLRPALIELGLAMPTRGLYLLDGELDTLSDAIGEWLLEARANLRTAISNER
jgi:FMN reductase